MKCPKCGGAVREVFDDGWPDVPELECSGCRARFSECVLCEGLQPGNSTHFLPDCFRSLSARVRDLEKILNDHLDEAEDV